MATVGRPRLSMHFHCPPSLTSHSDRHIPDYQLRMRRNGDNPKNGS